MRNMIGFKVGELIVISDSGERNKKKEILWLCSCSCGNTIKARGPDLRRGDYKSCGCKKNDFISAANKTHGMSSTDLYSIWGGIIDRCTNENSTYYNRYGGRGITVCSEWRNSFEAFLQDIGDRPSKKHSIDRIDNDRGYYPSNCRWATASEQMFNQGKQANCTSQFKNVYFNKKSGKWMARAYDGTTRVYLGMHETEEEAAQTLERYYGRSE